MASLLERTQKATATEGTTWSPRQEGDMVVGRIAAIQTVDTAMYGPRMLISIEGEHATEDGKTLEPGLFNIWQRAVLVRRVKELHLQPGDEVGIKYTGITEKGVKMFAVEVDYRGTPIEDRKKKATDLDDGIPF